MRRTLKDKFYKPALLLLAALFVGGSALSQRALNKDRERLELTRTTVLDNAPPVLAFTTVALGGFRGLIANALWIRMNDLQEDGKYFEMVQLSDWITKLQPQFATVWIHQAWNMSYNISIKFTDPKERWLWVKRGIELLRDEGIRYNPGEPLIYRELAWQFQHKLGHYLDDAHDDYKRYWAEEFFPIVGADGKPDYNALLDPKTPEDQQIVQMLREKFKMDPAWMKEVDDEYGPLEWRLPETHAIYWAHVGLDKTESNKLKREDIIQLKRVVFQSMQLAFQRGRLIFPHPDAKDFFYGPNIEIIKQANDSYVDIISSEPERTQHLKTGHKNFLRMAVYFLYTHNRTAAARQWFDYLKKEFPDIPEAKMDLDTYAYSRINEDIGETDPNRIKNHIEGLLETSLLDLAMGEDETARGYEIFANRIWQRYMNELGEQARARVGLEPMPQIKSVVVRRLTDPATGLNPLILARLRERLGMPPAPAITNAPAASTNAPGAAVPPPAQR